MESDIDMSISNNNQQVSKELAEAYYKANWQRNKILVLAIAMSVFLLYSVFSISYGKIYSSYLVDVRGMGTKATISLENGSEKQYQAMQKLSYLKDVGIKKVIGAGTYQNLWNGNIVFLDETAYEKLIKPAYTDIKGNYPETDNEIMLSVNTLNQMGIEEPEIGMDIEILIEFQNGKKERKYFKLSGYYTDYIDLTINVAEGYVAEAFLEKNEIELFPADKIMAAQHNLQERDQIERKLYFNIEMEYDSQQVISENPMVKQKIEGTFGGISIAIVCGTLIILCAYMLVFNVVSISMGKEIRQYGMLKVIGTTNKQLKNIVYRQNIKNIVRGICIGGMVGIILVKLFLSEILQKLFMHGLGKSDVSSFYPLYLFFACLFVFLISFLATGLAVRRVMKWNAIDSIKYTDVSISYRKKKIKSEKEISLLRFAWRNITRLKRRFLISVLSLFIGCITMLWAVVITEGVDITNEIEEYPDFQMGILTGIFRFPDKVPEKINDDTPVLPPDLIKTVLNFKGIQENTVEQTIGSYAIINFAEDIALRPRKESLETKEDIVFATLQIVDLDYLEQLSQYRKKYDLPIDIESLMNGTGCILLHYHELSQTLEEKAANMLGKPIHFYSLNANGKTSIESYKKGELKCAGYMDVTNKYFPKLQTTSMGNNINYFIMTKEAFEQLGFSEKCFDLSFDVLNYEETIIHQKLVQIIQRENIGNEMMDTFYLKANSDLLETEQSQIKTANLILGVLCFIIMMIGIMNYANTLMASFAARVKEFAIMESIGLTRKQLWKLLFMEGLYYWMIVMGGLTTIGTGSIWLLGKAIKKKLLYFKLIYPWQAVLGLAVVLFLICFAIPGIMYWKSQKQSLTDKLRHYVD